MNMVTLHIVTLRVCVQKVIDVKEINKVIDNLKSDKAADVDE